MEAFLASIDWLEIALFTTAALWFSAGFKASWRVGKLDIHLGWLGLSIWGFLAAIRYTAN